MKQVVTIFLSRIAGGALLFLLTIFLKELVLDELEFVSFSISYAYLIFLSSFSVIILNSIIVRKAFEINSAEEFPLILFYLIFFIFICYISVEFSIYTNFLKKETRLSSLYFLLSSLFGSVINGNFQIRQSFVKMAIWEFIKNITTFLIIYIFLKIKFHINSNTVIIILSISNLYYLFFFIRYFIKNYKNINIGNLKRYLNKHFKSDISFGFSFILFSSLANYVIAFDRLQIQKFNNTNLYKANYAYTADLVSKLMNSFLFPLNISISSNIGFLHKNGNVKEFNSKIFQSASQTLIIGLIITIILLISNSIISHIFNINTIVFNDQALIFYTVGISIYLSSILFQKQYDYTKFLKFLPFALLVISFFLIILVVNLFNIINISYFFYVFLAYAIFLLLSSLYLKKLKYAII